MRTEQSRFKYREIRSWAKAIFFFSAAITRCHIGGGGLKTTNVHYPPILEDRSPRLMCQEGHAQPPLPFHSCGTW